MFNNNIFNEIVKTFDEKKNSHSYIFYTNDFFACKEDVNNLIRNIFSVEDLSSVISDFIVVEKSEKKNILKDDVQCIKDMFQNKSYLNKNRIYLIDEAHKLNASSANLILKFLEEPLDGVIALFITTNLDAVLSTIKSRCQLFNVFYSNNKIPEKEVVLDEIFNNNKFISLFTIRKIFEKYDRTSLIEIFNNYLIECYNNLEKESNINKIEILNKCISMLNNNVNVDYVYDYLLLKLEGSDL